MFEFNKSNNRHMVYEIVYNSENGLTQQDIAQVSDLTTASIGNILPELEEENLIINCGFGESRGGRRPVIYKINPKRFYMIGLSIGVEYGVLLISDLKGEIIAKRSLQFNVNESAFYILEYFVQSIYQLIEESSIAMEEVLGIGVSSPGPVDSKNGVILTPPNLPNWRNVDICQFFERELNVPAILEKDANAMALSEVVYGPGMDSENILFIKVDYGIGYGLFIDGKIYRGTSGVAGEGVESALVSTDVTKQSDLVLPDVQAAGRTIVKKALSLQQTDELPADSVEGDELQLISLIDRYCKGDQVSTDLFLESAKYLGLGLAHKINFLNPELVVLGGRIAVDVADYHKWTMDYTMPNVLQQHATDVRILKSTFGDVSEALGATTVVLQRLFSSQQYKNMRGTKGVFS